MQGIEEEKQAQELEIARKEAADKAKKLRDATEGLERENKSLWQANKQAKKLADAAALQAQEERAWKAVEKAQQDAEDKRKKRSLTNLKKSKKSKP